MQTDEKISNQLENSERAIQNSNQNEVKIEDMQRQPENKREIIPHTSQ